MSASPFLIVGGGIAGLATALGLARIGLAAIVLEQAGASEAVGAGVQLGPNAVRALKWLGAWETVAPSCFAPEAIYVRDGLTGRLLQTVPLGPAFDRRFGEPYRVVHRADLLAGLMAAVAAVPAIEVQFGCAVRGAVETPVGIRLDFDLGPPQAAPGVIGADGIRSAMRTAFAPRNVVRTHGQTIYRALIPAGAASGGRALGAVNLWLCPGGHLVHYPVRSGRFLNIVAAADRPGPSAGWGEPTGREEVAAALDRSTQTLRDLIETPSQWQKWPAADCDPLRRWAAGRMVLVGDAAHAALPTLAQGAAMALEDAVVLALSLDHESSAPAAFERFAQLRQARAWRVQRASRRLASLYHARGPLRLARNVMLRSIGANRFLSGLDWLYSYDPTRP